MVYAGAVPSRLESGEVDLAFSRRPISRPGLVERIFEYERILVGLPSDHPLADQESVGMEQLRHEPWVMFPGTRGSSVREMGLRLATEAGYQPRIAQEAPDSYTILGLVAAGVGVTLTVSSVSHVATPGLRLVPLDGPARYLTATLVHRQNPSPATQAVLDVIAQSNPSLTDPRACTWTERGKAERIGPTVKGRQLPRTLTRLETTCCTWHGWT
ncbi:hypothetical protein GS444_20425 [Rhodococcus hoagii]|nr:hypothetical protein [Prescottella equi]